MNIYIYIRIIIYYFGLLPLDTFQAVDAAIAANAMEGSPALACFPCLGKSVRQR